MISYGQRLLDKADKVDEYAARNGELHVLCHEMLCALESLEAPADLIHAFRARLHDVPQCRAEHPLRRGY
jgi:hypothetical protein